MNKGIWAMAIGAAALVAATLPTKTARADAIASWLANLPAGGNIAGSDVDNGFCLSGWSLRRTADGKIFWWHCGDGG